MNVKEKLLQILERPNYTQKTVATKTGLSATAVSQYLKGTYKGNIANVEAALTDFINREECRANRREVRATFVPTQLASMALSLITSTHMDGDIGVIYGPAGMGKSMVLREYSYKSKGAILIEADPGCTARVLLQELCTRLGAKRTGNIHELSEECIQALTGTGWVILVDEAELLPYRALEVLRRIHDRSGVAIVLAGMPRLLINLRGSRGEFAQLYSRVGMCLNLETHKDKSEQEDFNRILGSLLADGDEDSLTQPELAEAFFRCSKGNYRRMFKLARGVVRASAIGDQGVSVKLVESYAQMLIH
ncbi:AAA family ATPase [Cedecea sp. NFIX57]|uniref:AAA family ATPase n=1 Tax=Cedecea sp. NFIX57 TaxID=1566286 RepID=UPI000A0CEEB8|nr:AAA family ATPase [Cedecea sp. NFIX57]SMG61418.1 DNA transposition protein, AAA+ family ATPase [Cedecea sp. NFIX57]